MMSADPTPIIAALGIKPTYSPREAAVLLGGRIPGWTNVSVKTSSSWVTEVTTGSDGD
jgi:hypothetical protein